MNIEAMIIIFLLVQRYKKRKRGEGLLPMMDINKNRYVQPNTEPESDELSHRPAHEEEESDELARSVVRREEE